jgi:Uma2 family endonuclease
MQRKMAPVSRPPEIIEEQLSSNELAARYRLLCEDPLYANVPGKIEIDLWGRLLMSPASNYHSALQSALSAKLAALGGRAFVEASVLTSAGVLVADVAWASDAFMRAHGFETPYTAAPELCMEVVSPSNSRKELSEKVDAYLAAGAQEVWLVYPQSKRFEFHSRQGLIEQTAYAVDLTDLFQQR